jgi:hypothetical protein
VVGHLARFNGARFIVDRGPDSGGGVVDVSNRRPVILIDLRYRNRCTADNGAEMIPAISASGRR